MRKAENKRSTNETTIAVAISLDGGENAVSTPIGFFTHMLELFAKHAGFGLTITAEGDTHVDFHHTVEDTGILLGSLIAEALGDKKGITRYASLSLPMDETLVDVALDVSGRAYFVANGFDALPPKVGDFDTELMVEFFRAFAMNAGLTLHITLRYGKNAHHILEAAFKGVARAMKTAVAITGSDIPSTKGVL